MSNKHYSVNHEFEVTLNLKVKITNLSNYQSISQEKMKTYLEEVEREIRQDLHHNICKDYVSEDISQMVDVVMFNVDLA
jgi:hypothetical protein